MLHGLQGGAYNFYHTFPYLSKYFNAIIPDMRGFGLSSQENPAFTCEEYATDIYLLLKELNIEKVTVYGWSFGNYISLKFAALFPEMTKKVILSGTLPIDGLSIYNSKNGRSPKDIFMDKENFEKHVSY